jgi:hypothetical protein
MKRRLLVLLVLLFSVQSVSAQQPAPSADDVARRAIDMLAGAQWDQARYLAFTFTVVRGGNVVVAFPQKYDRFTGDYRVSGKNQKGETFDIVMNVNTKEGKAWKDGQPVADPKEMLTVGYRRFINDTYWLLMPLKSMDPGVKREYAGEKTDACGNVFDVVHLSFESVGLTPGDNYWMWVNRNTGLVEQWHMKLEGSKPEDEPSVVEFRDYQRFGGLLISTKRQIRGKEQMIRLDDITVSKDVPADAWK